MVVGNKIDLEGDRKVPADRPIREYKDKFDIDCWEVSAKTGYNVREIFTELLESSSKIRQEFTRKISRSSRVHSKM
jgi:GTPase SAR1 family protein